MSSSEFLISNELVAEAKRAQELGTVTAYQDGLVKSAIHHAQLLHSRLRENLVSSESEGASEEERSGAATAAMIQHIAIQRLKRAALVHQRTRIDAIVSFLWQAGGAGASGAARLVSEFGDNISDVEKAFAREYISLVGEYKGSYIELDLGAILRPPRELYTEVRVLSNCGEIVTDSGPIKLIKDTQQYLKKSDIEHLLTAGHLKQI